MNSLSTTQRMIEYVNKMSEWDPMYTFDYFKEKVM